MKEDDIEAARQPLSIHMDNWRSSSDRSELTAELIAKEVSEGWVESFSGGIEEAQQRWPKGVAVGRLSIAMSDNRDPRLWYQAPTLAALCEDVKPCPLQKIFCAHVLSGTINMNWAVFPLM